jgi:hypothetical protein
VKSIVALRKGPVRKNGSMERINRGNDGVWDGDRGRGGSGSRRCVSGGGDLDDSGDMGGGGRDGKMGERETGGDEEGGHVNGGKTDPNRHRADVEGAGGVEMSSEDGRVQECVGHPEQKQDEID